LELVFAFVDGMYSTEESLIFKDALKILLAWLHAYWTDLTLNKEENQDFTI